MISARDLLLHTCQAMQFVCDRVNKFSALIVDLCGKAAKATNKFLQESCDAEGCLVLQRFGLGPFRKIVDGYNHVSKSVAFGKTADVNANLTHHVSWNCNR